LDIARGNKVTEDKFERLLGRLPEIAQAINAFSSETVQQRAFDALIEALSRDRAPAAPSSADEQAPPESPAEGAQETPAASGASTTPAVTRRVRRRRADKKTFTAIRNLNFRPEGKESLRDFAASKRPRTLMEKNLLAVYYLEHMMEVSEVAVGHVLSVYKELGWKPPSTPDNSLAVVASMEQWLDTRNMESIKTTHSGRSYVEHDMPQVTKDKK
jgi:hypothetical protein